MNKNKNGTVDVLNQITSQWEEWMPEQLEGIDNLSRIDELEYWYDRVDGKNVLTAVMVGGTQKHYKKSDGTWYCYTKAV